MAIQLLSLLLDLILQFIPRKIVRSFDFQMYGSVLWNPYRQKFVSGVKHTESILLRPVWSLHVQATAAILLFTCIVSFNFCDPIWL